MPLEPGDTCWTALHAASDGDREAQADFAARYESTTHGFLAARWRGRLREADIGDAIQEVFVECLKEVVAFYRPGATDLDGTRRELLELLG